MTTIADLYTRQQGNVDPYGSYQATQHQPPQQMHQPQTYQHETPLTKDELDLIIDDINQDTEEEEVKKEPKKKKIDKINEDKLINFVKEGAILVAIYVIMSGSGVRKFVAGYISQLNRDESGRVPLVGLVAYGAIIAALFIVARQYLMKPKRSKN